MIRKKFKEKTAIVRRYAETVYLSSVGLSLLLIITLKVILKDRHARKRNNKIMSIKKTALNEEPFGIRSLKRLDIGDIVKWSELSLDYKKEVKIGIISELYLEKRGNRNVALAKVYEVTNNKSNLSLLGTEREILVVSLELLSKVNAKNEQRKNI